MKNSCPQWDSSPRHSAYEANTLSVELLELFSKSQAGYFQFKVLLHYISSALSVNMLSINMQCYLRMM